MSKCLYCIVDINWLIFSGKIRLNGGVAQIAVRNVPATNGVLHGLDAPLVWQIDKLLNDGFLCYYLLIIISNNYFHTFFRFVHDIILLSVINIKHFSEFFVLHAYSNDNICTYIDSGLHYYCNAAKYCQNHKIRTIEYLQYERKQKDR